ncbi:cobalamin-binding protein [Shewanella intestini]|uniref:Cobalamin-binding protein n=1 Tax=Shewanella intestini TaxID=2017544 RepID=A0ABS5I2Q5_9GAMM|nr:MULTISPECIES: cobalamin-binding protein [Shewanella]MBR9727949.1 cobalamin-binding protein [Shewanella intestini]MRG36500.1 ABC transporter substrate-binding protein [Shewanella sp. XMDDZSB0408]
MKLSLKILMMSLSWCGLTLSSSSYAQSSPKLVVLSPPVVEMLYEIGAGDNIVGTVNYADYPEAANHIPRIGHHNYINYEALMLLQPDAIIVNSTSTAAPMLARLKELGFTLIDASVNKLEQIPARMRELGKLTGHNTQAKASADKFSATLVHLRQTYQDLPKIDLFYQVWPNPLTTASSNWMNEIFSGCGANNVFANNISDYPQVSLEQVIATYPDIIIRPDHHGTQVQNAVNWLDWPEIPAVANGQIYPIKGDIVHRTGPRVLQGMLKICQQVAQARAQKLQQQAHD